MPRKRVSGKFRFWFEIQRRRKQIYATCGKKKYYEKLKTKNHADSETHKKHLFFLSIYTFHLSPPLSYLSAITFNQHSTYINIFVYFIHDPNTAHIHTVIFSSSACSRPQNPIWKFLLPCVRTYMFIRTKKKRKQQRNRFAF